MRVNEWINTRGYSVILKAIVLGMVETVEG